MIRATASAALLGASVAAVAALMSIGQGLPGSTAPRLVSGTEIAQGANESESWPICTSMESMADSADWAQLDPDFAAGKKALAANDWTGAIEALSPAALRDSRNADLQNYLGYAYRRLRQFDTAFRHYQQALALNPRHRGAHGHLGEAYLAAGKLARAEEHLAMLERICLIACEEYDGLRRAIDVYKGSATR